MGSRGMDAWGTDSTSAGLRESSDSWGADANQVNAALPQRAGASLFAHPDAFYRALVDAAVDAIIVIDAKGVIQLFSGSAERLFGYAAAEVLGRNVSVLMPEPMAHEHDGYVQAFIRSRQPHVIGRGRNVVGLKKNGDTFPMHLSVGHVAQGEDHAFVGICHDLTDYHEALMMIAREKARFRDVVQNQKELIVRLDPDFRITFANASFHHTLALDEGAAHGTYFFEGALGETQGHQQELRALFDSDAPERVFLKIRMRQGSAHKSVEWFFKRTETDAYGPELQGFGIDVSDRDRAIDESNYVKSHDRLTGLHNRQGLKRAFSSVRHTNGQWAVVYLDCNRFDLFNHRYGLRHGDAFLCVLADALKAHVTEHHAGVCGRLSDDDFIAVIPFAEKVDLDRSLESLIQDVGAPKSIEAGPVFSPSLSVGVSVYPDHGSDLDELMHRAGAALRYGKAQSETVMFYSDMIGQRASRAMDIEQGLKAALIEHGLDIFVQPKVDLKTGRCVGFESLLRWGFQGEPVSPAEFIPVAEMSNLGRLLDRYVLEAVANGIARIRRVLPDYDLPVAVNITAGHFSEQNLKTFIQHVLEDRGLEARLLEVEITEGVVINITEQINRNLLGLQAMGIHISIDDFGTGYSSLSYLKKLPVNALKIDKSFIDDISHQNGLKLVEAIVSISQAMNLQVIAEGVESQGQVDLLLAMGCQVGQGYHFSRPFPIDQIPAYLARQAS